MIDVILHTMDPACRELLKSSVEGFRLTGEKKYKDAVLRLIRDYDDKDAIIRFVSVI
ncbi:MAG: hypothetical protein IJT70_07055 [Clostridia bacterium]|nr:hypothetical protein [Clostridia bacterium]